MIKLYLVPKKFFMTYTCTYNMINNDNGLQYIMVLFCDKMAFWSKTQSIMTNVEFILPIVNHLLNVKPNRKHKRDVYQ